MGNEITIKELPGRKEPRSVILVEPEFFQVVDQKNPYMKEQVDIDLAVRQWNELLSIYKGLEEEGILNKVSVVPGAAKLEDMVFCANQSLPFLDSNNQHCVVLSNMRYPSRQKEVAHFEKFYRENGYGIEHIPEEFLLEGMGDCIYHPFTALLWMGHGYRTSIQTADLLENIIGMPVVPLKLVSEYFYHLDTCFLPVNERKVLLCPNAFDDASMNRISSVFEEVVEVAREEAIETFCLNAHCIYDRGHPVAIVPSGDHTVKTVLQEEGYRILEADTSEFIKSGGSVYCMKMMYYD